MHPEFLARRLALFAGLLDFASGLGFVALPVLTLRMMLIPVPGAEALAYVRFVGAFVAAVGASYLWALHRPEERLRVVLDLTRLFRLASGGYALAGVCAGWLSPVWLVVTLADAFLIAAQTWLLCKGVGRGK